MTKISVGVSIWLTIAEKSKIGILYSFLPLNRNSVTMSRLSSGRLYEMRICSSGCRRALWPCWRTGSRPARSHSRSCAGTWPPPHAGRWTARRPWHALPTKVWQPKSSPWCGYGSRCRARWGLGQGRIRRKSVGFSANTTMTSRASQKRLTRGWNTLFWPCTGLR